MELVKKIDMHVHTIRVAGPARRDGSRHAMPEQLCEMYDQIGVEKGVIMPNCSPEGNFVINTNEDTIEIVKAYPERFTWFCNIDPRMAENTGETDFTYFIEYYKERGAKGVGEVTCNLYFDDPRVLALFRDCEKCGMPVTIHVGHTNGEYGLIDELHFPRLEKVLQMFPQLRLIGHSWRFWSEIGGEVTEETRHGWPQGKVMPGGRVVELMRKYPNLCADLSAGSGHHAMTRDPEFACAFMEEFQDRLYYGTDICAPENIELNFLKLGAFLDDAVQNGKISYEAYWKISRGNALELLK